MFHFNEDIQKGSWLRSCPLTDYIDHYFNIRSYEDFKYRCEEALGITEDKQMSYAAYARFRLYCKALKKRGFTLHNVSRAGCLLIAVFPYLPKTKGEFKHGLFDTMTGRVMASNGDIFIANEQVIREATIDSDRYSVSAYQTAVTVPMESFVVNNTLKSKVGISEDSPYGKVVYKPLALDYDFKDADLLELGMSLSYIRMIVSGERTVNVKQAVKLEQVTKGAFSRKVLRADWAEIWPELVTGAEQSEA